MHTHRQSLRDLNYLFRAADKDAIQYEVGPEQRPLALDVLKQLQLCGLVIQSVWILYGDSTNLQLQYLQNQIQI